MVDMLARVNQAKKRGKNAIYVGWNARICGADRENSLMPVALLVIFLFHKKRKGVHADTGETQPGWVDAFVLAPLRRWSGMVFQWIAIDLNDCDKAISVPTSFQSHYTVTVCHAAVRQTVLHGCAPCR